MQRMHLDAIGGAAHDVEPFRMLSQGLDGIVRGRHHLATAHCRLPPERLRARSVWELAKLLGGRGIPQPLRHQGFEVVLQTEATETGHTLQHALEGVHARHAPSGGQRADACHYSGLLVREHLRLATIIIATAILANR